MVKRVEQDNNHVEPEPEPPHHSSMAAASSSLSPLSLPAPNPSSPDTSSSISSDHTFHGFSPPKDHPVNPAAASPAPPVVAVANRLVQDQQQLTVVKTEPEPEPETGFADDGGGGRGIGGGRRGRGRQRTSTGVLTRARREKMMKRAGLGLRVCEFLICLVSFSVMAADKNRGWALDSFDHYIEFRYSISVNVIGFAYSGLQGFELLLQLLTGKDLTRSQLRYYIDFTMDQILAYLLLSASSSAFTRIDDWILNWGNDKFPAMASTSVGVSFIAFVAFALSSLISGYILCTNRFA